MQVNRDLTSPDKSQRWTWNYLGCKHVLSNDALIGFLDHLIEQVNWQKKFKIDSLSDFDNAVGLDKAEDKQKYDGHVILNKAGTVYATIDDNKATICIKKMYKDMKEGIYKPGAGPELTLEEALDMANYVLKLVEKYHTIFQWNFSSSFKLSSFYPPQF